MFHLKVKIQCYLFTKKKKYSVTLVVTQIFKPKYYVYLIYKRMKLLFGDVFEPQESWELVQELVQSDVVSVLLFGVWSICQREKKDYPLAL